MRRKRNRDGRTKAARRLFLDGVRYASAHDLRGSFGHRWASRVRPATLKSLMRHTDINTTMTYYVGTNAEAMAHEIGAVFDLNSNTRA